MATKIFPCKRCGKPVTRQAPTCRRCGHSYLLERHRRIGWIASGTLAAFVLIVVGVGLYTLFS